MNPLPSTPIQGPTPKPVKLSPLRYPADVVARMKATGIDPIAAESRLSALPRDQAETTWANVTDTYRHNTDLSSKVAAYQGADKPYQQARMRQPANSSWTAFDDMGAQFKNSFVDLAQGVTDLVPSTVDIGMSLLSNPRDDSWYRKWDKATDDYFAKAKYYVSPEAQSAVWDEKTGLNWRAVAGMMGSTAGFLTTTMLPFVGVLGRAGVAAEGISAGSAALRMLTDPRIQAGAIGYMQSLPGYKESAIKAGYSRNQAALIAPALSAAQAALEFVGGDFLMKGASKLSAQQASQVVRQLGNEAATEAFKGIAGKQLTEETFRDVINLTGKGFFNRLKQPEVWQGIWQGIKTGAIPEMGEELMQAGAEAAIQKMADIHYGYGKMGDETVDGKGFDPTVVGTAIQAATGVLMGGIMGGSMGSMFHTPTSVSQQTIWGQLDADVRNVVQKGGDPSQDTRPIRMYRLAEKLHGEGKLSDQDYQQAITGMDDMVRVSQKLSGLKADAPTRFALFNLDSQQKQWQSRLQSEVQAPLQRLQELADERIEGQWFPKDGLSALDRAEAQDLIQQELPRKAQVASVINQTIDSQVSDLMNPTHREKTLKSYKQTLAGLADEFENGPPNQPTPPGPDTFQENQVSGLSKTIDTPEGRYALADTPEGQKVLRVETSTVGASDAVGTQTDPTIGRFKGYTLPSKGQPQVTLHTISDQTRHDQLLDAFSQNDDAAEGYADWRNRLAANYADNELDGLLQAESVYQKELAELAPNAPDWQKQDVARKGQWLKAAMASQASNPSESRYGWADWAEGYLGDQLQQAGITRDDLAKLPANLQSDITSLLQAGEYQQAQNLVKQSQNGQTNLSFDDALSAPSEPDSLSTQLTAATQRGRAIETATTLAPDLLGGPEILEQIEQLALTGQLTADQQQQLVDRLEQTTRSLDEIAEQFAALAATEPGQPDSPETGTSQSETAGDQFADLSIGEQQPVPDGRTESDPASATPVGTSPDVVEKPKKRSGNKQPDVIERQPRDLHEAILAYFAKGNRLRRSDLAQYGDPNLMRTAKGGNPYLAFTAGDDKAPSLDLLARSIVEESLGQNMELADEQAVMQEIIDTVQSFSQTGGPKQQLISYQQQQVQVEQGQADALVAEATAMTPIQLMEPLMAGMDQAGVAVGIQDQLINIVAENYVTADGLDWVGVIHLLRANSIFERYQELRNILLPLLDEVAQSIPVTRQEYAERQATDMSANAWEQMAQFQHLTDTQYNELTDLFYGPESSANTSESKRTTDGESARERTNGPQARTTNPAGESAGISGQRDDPSRGSGADTAIDRLGSDRVVEVIATATRPEQQVRIETVYSEYENDIARLTQENDQLTRQADKLRKQLRTRTQTGEIFADQPTGSSQYDTTTLVRLQAQAAKEAAAFENGIYRVPNTINVALRIENGDPVESGIIQQQQFVPTGSISNAPGTAQDEDIAVFRKRQQQARDMVAKLRLPFLLKLAAFVRQQGPKKAIELLKSAPGGMSAISQFIVQPSLDIARLRQASELEAWLDQQPKSSVGQPVQLDLTANQQSGIDAEDALKTKLAELEAQIAANQTKIANLQATQQQAIEVALAAPEQTSLFTSEISNQTIDTENEALAVEELADQQAKAPLEAEEELSVEQQVEADETLEKLADFGQKIGAARKDTAERGYKLSKTAGDKQPGWARKYKVFSGKDGTFEVARVNGNFMRTLKRGFASEQNAYSAIPLVEVASNHRVYQKAEGNYAIYRVFSSGKVWDVQDGFASREAGLQYMAKHAVTIIGKKSPVIERPHLDSIQRTGKDYRQGKNATPQMLLDTFGFRGGEWGNWLSAKERQEVLNLAYDAFMDLATALDVPPKALSLGGELSIGFGSRGKGLSGAAAHYETSRAVINLTKVRGAGSLAHEWFHGLDNYLAKQDGKASATRTADGVFEVPSKDRVYFSHGKSLVRSGVRKELADAFEGTWKALSTKTVEKAADGSKTQAAVKQTGESLMKALADLRSTLTRESSYGRKKKPATPEQLARFDQLASELQAGNIGERAWYGREKSRFNGDYTLPPRKPCMMWSRKPGAIR